MMYGLGFGGREWAALRSLPPAMQRIVLSEIQADPSVAEDMKRLLREPDPERAIAQEIAAVISSTVAAGIGGYGSGLGKIGFRHLKERVERVTEKAVDVVQRVTEIVSEPFKKIEAAAKRIGLKRLVAVTLAPFTLGASLMIDPKIRAKVKEYTKAYGPLVLTVVAVALAYPTGGASMAIIPLIQGYQTLQENKRKAKEVVGASEEEKAALDAEIAREEKLTAESAEKTYSENEQAFTDSGYPRARWEALSLDEKVNLIVSFANAVDGLPPGEPTPTPPGEPTPTPPGEPTPTPPEGAPPEGEAPKAPVGKYDLVIERQGVATANTSDEIFSKAESMTKPGDRFEIWFNGKSTGLKIRTGVGVISVPADQEAKVRALTPDQVKDLLARSEEAAKVEKPGGFPVWLLAAPVVIYAATR